MKKQLITALLVCFAFAVQAQDVFFPRIRVEFEKTISVRQLYKDLESDDESWYERIKNMLPVTSLNYYEFIGDSSASLFRPGKEVPVDNRSFYRPVADKNVVFTDFKNGVTVSQKPVYEETFLVQDSLRKIKWKITGDIRTIAGYDCRKAIGILDDTIAVFAFYADELMVPGGPEGINGLPGMILGMGIPRLHATWFATKVEVFDINMKPVSAPTKGKKVTQAEMTKALEIVLRQWGSYGNKLIINFVI